MPWVEPNMVFPECLPRRNHTTLLGNNNLGHSLPRVFLSIPLLSSVLNRLILKILTKLNLEKILRIILGIELLQPIAQNMVRMKFGIYLLFVELLLSLGRRNEAIFDNVIAEPVRSLRILANRLELISPLYSCWFGRYEHTSR
jgi:hypothetical protein